MSVRFVAVWLRVPVGRMVDRDAGDNRECHDKIADVSVEDGIPPPPGKSAHYDAELT